MGSHLFNAMRKYPKDAWSIEALAEVHGEKAVLDSLETFVITVFDSRNPERGYNICRGGEGRTGPHTAETIKLIGENSKKMWTNPETVEKMRVRTTATADRQRGVPKSEEHIGAIREAMQDPKVRKHQSEAAKQRFAEGRGNLHDAETEAKRLEACRTPEFRAAVAARSKGNSWKRDWFAKQEKKPASPVLPHVNKGRKFSDEHRRKLSEARKRVVAQGATNIL